MLGIPFASLLLPTIQLVFSNFYLGIAQGALSAASEYTTKSTRAWPFGGDNKDTAIDEFYILERYGEFRAHLAAADALTDRAGAEIANLYREAGQYGSVVEDSNALATKVSPNYLVPFPSDISRPNPPYTLSTTAAFQNIGAEAKQTNGYSNGHTNGTSKKGREAISAQRRGEVAAFVAHAKVVTTDTGLSVTSGIFEMLGSRATGKK